MEKRKFSEVLHWHFRENLLST